MYKLFKTNTFKLLILSIFTIIIFEFFKLTLKIDNLLYNDLSKNLSHTQINDFFKRQLKLKWIGYFIVPIFILFKTSIITSALYIGCFFFSKSNISFKNILKIVLNVEFIFILVPILKLIWFCFFQTNYTLEDIQYFYPLSALNIVGYKGLDAWFIYPLQTLNLFEVAYWLLLSYYIGKIASPTKNIEENKYPMDFGLKIVASSYGSALLLWVVVVMFFTLNYS
jgi:hypothetical protein